MAAGACHTPPDGAVASTRHTVGLLVALLVLSVSGAIQSPISDWPNTLSTPHARLLLYAKILALQWVWVGYLWFGMRHARGSIPAIIDDGAIWSGRRWLRYVMVGVAGFIFWLVLGAALGTILHPSPEQLRGLQAMLPQAPLETVLWIGFAFSASFCEEIVYRGYLIRQFRALTGSTLVAIFLQAAVYGLAHLALPIAMVVPVGLLGLGLGTLAVWQESLVPCMILHAGTGLIALVASGR